MSNRSAPNKKPFIYMKTVRILWDIEHHNSGQFNRQCSRMRLLTTYSLQILSNGETHIIDCGSGINWEFIKSALRLCQLLYLDFCQYNSEIFIKIVTSLESILQNRKEENINNAIELKVYDNTLNFETFNKIIKQSSSIKLS